MKELLRSNDLVLISFLTAVLEDAGVATVVLDEHMSNLDGSVVAIPRRLMVADDQFSLAKRLIEAAQKAQAADGSGGAAEGDV